MKSIIYLRGKSDGGAAALVPGGVEALMLAGPRRVTHVELLLADVGADGARGAEQQIA